MTLLKGSEVEAYVSRPNAKPQISLIYGPDAGLVRERVNAILAKAVDDPNDPFSMARIDGDTLSDDPQRLVEEVNTMPLFGGRRAVHVRAGNKNISSAVEILAAAPPGADCRVVIEAGDLARSAPLRTLCDKSKEIAVIVCYADTERDVARVIDDEMRQANLTITPDARALLLSLLGGDRMASRGEIQKLALYAHGQGSVEVDDVIAIASDAGAIELSTIADAAFAGKPEDVRTQYARLVGEGTQPSVIAGNALRQVMQLHRARLAMDAGDSLDQAVGGFRPMLHFKRKPQVEAALRNWTSGRLEKAMAQFADIALESRRRPALADAVVERALLATAQAARRRA
ncbi:MAG: DNA polymerase III subunit delta [Xanthobacteraceae bacterium]